MNVAWFGGTQISTDVCYSMACKHDNTLFPHCVEYVFYKAWYI